MQDTPLESTYRKYFPLIRAKCARMLSDTTEAQDLAQETFARLWENRASLRDPEAELGWIYQTATRLAIDRIRSRAVASRVQAALVSETVAVAAGGEAREDLHRFMRKMRPQELEAVVLSRIDGMTHGEIASVMLTSERTVRRLLQAADEKVQQWKTRS